MLAREPQVAWRTLRPYLVHELEPGRAPEQPPRPWLNPRQMALARKVVANERARQAQHRPPPMNLVGYRYGRLVVLGPAGKRGRNWVWLCRCDCGGMKVAAGLNLRQGDTSSCGCLHRERARLQSQRNRGRRKARN